MADVVDLEDWKATRIAAVAGPQRFAGCELGADGATVVLTLPSGHVETLRGVVAVRIAQLMAPLGEYAQDVEDAERDGGLFR